MEYWCSDHYRVHHMVTARRLIHSFTYRTAIVTASILRFLVTVSIDPLERSGLSLYLYIPSILVSP